jgi:hypothetical protein
MNNDEFIYKIQLKTIHDPLTGCWIYPSSNHKRYPHCTFDGKRELIFHIIYNIFHGPPTKWILHKCNNKLCVNPNHLYDGSPKDNVADMIKAGTHYHQPQTHDPVRRRQIKLAGMKDWRKRNPDYKTRS